MISVVIRTYKRPKDLMNCLESVIRQHHRDFEIIVVDDDKDCADGFETYNAITYFYEGVIRRNNIETRYMQSKSKGRASARNTGVKAAKGDIIAFCDDDTIVPPNWLSTIQSWIEKGYDAVGFTYEYPPEYRKPLWSKLSKINHMIGPKIFGLALGFEATTVGGGCGAVHRRVVEKLGLWDEDKIRAEDMNYGVRFLREGFKKVNIEDMDIIHHHHRVKRADEEGHYKKEYEWMRTMLGLVENTFRNRMIMIVYIGYRLIIHVGFCIATRSSKPLDMTRGNIAAFRGWIN